MDDDLERKLDEAGSRWRDELPPLGDMSAPLKRSAAAKREPSTLLALASTALIIVVAAAVGFVFVDRANTSPVGLPTLG
ncbi:MAG TPA: hypothetical protein VH371_00445, partial [Candidatus Limnocylindrales bacterium]